MKKIFALLLLLIGISTLVVFADQSMDDKISITDESVLNESDLYKFKFEELSKDYDRLANTIYWALGSLFTLSLIIIGGNFYINKQVYKSDFTVLESNISSHFSKLEKELNKSIDHKIENTRNDFSKHIADELENSRRRFESYKNEADSEIKKIGDFDDKIKKLIAKSDDDFKTTISKVHSSISSRVDSLDKSITSRYTKLELEVLDLRIHFWELEGVHHNVISICVEAAEHSLDLSIDWRVNRYLGILLKSLESIDEIDTSDRLSINQLRNKLTNDFDDISMIISKRLGDLKVR